jgi:hypothetical protein
MTPRSYGEMKEGISVPGATRVPVSISGSWADPPRKAWFGWVESPALTVAILFFRFNDGITRWCRSGYAIPHEVTLAISPLDNSYSRVTIEASIGGATMNAQGRIISRDYLPEIPLINTFETGRVIPISSIRGDPEIDILALFVERGDVTSKRKGIWHVRKCLRGEISGPLLLPLTYGKTGMINPP